jgi:hypothetical protein
MSSQILDITFLSGTSGLENPKVEYLYGLHSDRGHDTLHIMPEVWP